MDTEARRRHCLESAHVVEAIKEYEDQQKYNYTTYYRSNKDPIALPRSDTKFPKLRSKIPAFHFEDKTSDGNNNSIKKSEINECNT